MSRNAAVLTQRAPVRGIARIGRPTRTATAPRDALLLLGGLLLVETAFVALFWAAALPAAPRTFTLLFDLDAEVSIPAWFSSLQLGCVGILFLQTARRCDATPHVASWLLGGLGLAFLFLSMDEAAAVHEKVSGLLKHFDATPRFRGGHGLWIPAYAAVGLAALTFTARPLSRLARAFPREAALIGAGALIFLTGAVGLEILSYELLRDGTSPWLYRAEVSLEEFCEMAGISVVLYAAIGISRGVDEARP